MATVREKLLEAADALFYEEGVRSVGIDRIIERAGVAKASLYSAFGSKDELVRAYLRDRHQRFRGRLDEILEASGPTPSGRILGIFDALVAFMAEPGFRGCAFMNACAEASPGGPVEQATHDFRKWLHDLFTNLVGELNAKDPQMLVQQLIVLYDGAHIGAWLDHNPSAPRAAKDMAAILLALGTGTGSNLDSQL